MDAVQVNMPFVCCICSVCRANCRRGTAFLLLLTKTLKSPLMKLLNNTFMNSKGKSDTNVFILYSISFLTFTTRVQLCLKLLCPYSVACLKGSAPFESEYMCVVALQICNL
uniref:Uncharacterized protein n=1 Tax=Pyxicephalus adspersus TaxID=30357 RepID=A0AAV2ZXH3_PYXAD|nr:TPA: hypothetical protein GDO54_014182 [Pyxicephalus adspersus]